MLVCNSSVWLNGVILCSIGVSFLFSAFMLSSSLSIVMGKQSLYSTVSNYVSDRYYVKNDAVESSVLPRTTLPRIQKWKF